MYLEKDLSTDVCVCVSVNAMFLSIRIDKNRI
jgi:hypothetical protein